MTESKQCSSGVWGPQAGGAFPLVDLLRQDQSHLDDLKYLNQQRRLLSMMVGGCFSRLFNGLSCQVDYAEFKALSFSAHLTEPNLWVHALNHQGNQAWLSIPVHQLFQLAILFFGGALLEADTKLEVRPLSETEQRLLLRLAQHQLDILSDLLNEPAWQWDLQVVPVESLPQNAPGLSSEATFLLGDHGCQMRLWWLPAHSESMESSPSSDNLESQLQAALLKTPVSLRVVLSELQLNLQHLQGLQVGDVLPLELSDMAPAYIGDLLCLQGKMAEHQGGLVLQVAAI